MRGCGHAASGGERAWDRVGERDEMGRVVNSVSASVVEQPPMPITEEIVDAVLRCETKAYLKLSATPGSPSEFNGWQRIVKENYREECNGLLRSASQWFRGTPDLQSLKSCRHELILGYIVELAEINTRIDALVLRRQPSSRIDF